MGFGQLLYSWVLTRPLLKITFAKTIYGAKEYLRFFSCSERNKKILSISVVKEEISRVHFN